MEEHRAKEKKESIVEAAAALRDADVLKPSRRCEGHEGSPSRKKVFLSGGMIWAMVTIIHPSGR